MKSQSDHNVGVLMAKARKAGQGETILEKVDASDKISLKKFNGLVNYNGKLTTDDVPVLAEIFGVSTDEILGYEKVS